MIDALRAQVCEANLALVREGLVLRTWGNASGIDREHGLVAIKPSGVDYASLTPDRIAVVDLDGEPVEAGLKPSVDTAAHVTLYKAFAEVGGIVHTHSHYATCWAQARRPIPCLGTTHADYFCGEVFLTEALSEDEVAEDYERHMGERIVRRYAAADPMKHPAVLAAGHAPFAWGKTVDAAVENAFVLEEVARMAWHTLMLNPAAAPLEDYLLDKHFLRKHGTDAYYGQ